MFRQVKLGVAAVLVILTIVLVVQNSDVVETSFLVFSFSMSRGLLLLVTLLVGVVVGMIVSARVFRDKAPKQDD